MQQAYLPYHPAPVQATVHLPGSKSLTNRALLLASLSEGTTTLKGVLASQDTQACQTVLAQAGVKQQGSLSLGEVTIEGTQGRLMCPKAGFNCQQSGIMGRFLPALCAAQQSGTFFIDAQAQLRQRPMKPLFDALRQLGNHVTFHQEIDQLPVTLTPHPVKTASLHIDNRLSSQFVSGLLLAGGLLPMGVTLHLTDARQMPYVAMTQQMMQDFGVLSESTSEMLTVLGNQSYQSPGEYVIEPDMSTASYFWALAMLTQGQVTVLDTACQSIQGDCAFLSLIERMGANVLQTSHGVQVTGPSRIQGIHAHMRHCSDTFMTIAVLACFAQTRSIITGIHHTRYQESDRIQAMATALEQVGVWVEASDDGLLIDPTKNQWQTAQLDSCGDHRIAMALSLIGLRQPGVSIQNAACVAKTCPDYFAKMWHILGY